MSIPDPLAFSAEWVAAWNARDVEAVLSHFHDDVVFTSPTAARVVPADSVVQGPAWPGRWGKPLVPGQAKPRERRGGRIPACDHRG